MKLFIDVTLQLFKLKSLTISLTNVPILKNSKKFHVKDFLVSLHDINRISSKVLLHGYIKLSTNNFLNLN